MSENQFDRVELVLHELVVKAVRSESYMERDRIVQTALQKIRMIVAPSEKLKQ